MPDEQPAGMTTPKPHHYRQVDQAVKDGDSLEAVSRRIKARLAAAQERRAKKAARRTRESASGGWK